MENRYKCSTLINCLLFSMLIITYSCKAQLNYESDTTFNYATTDNSVVSSIAKNEINSSEILPVENTQGLETFDNIKNKGAMGVETVNGENFMDTKSQEVKEPQSNTSENSTTFPEASNGAFYTEQKKSEILAAFSWLSYFVSTMDETGMQLLAITSNSKSGNATEKSFTDFIKHEAMKAQNSLENKVKEYSKTFNLSENEESEFKNFLDLSIQNLPNNSFKQDYNKQRNLIVILATRLVENLLDHPAQYFNESNDTQSNVNFQTSLEADKNEIRSIFKTRSLQSSLPPTFADLYIRPGTRVGGQVIPSGRIGGWGFAYDMRGIQPGVVTNYGAWYPLFYPYTIGNSFTYTPPPPPRSVDLAYGSMTPDEVIEGVKSLRDPNNGSVNETQNLRARS